MSERPIRRRDLLCIGLCLAWLPLVAQARQESATERAHELGLELLERGCPGASIAVGVEGELVFAEGFGMADLEQELPVTPSTRFRIGSVSKTITAAALARLWEDERVDIDAPIQRYVPDFPVKPLGDISLRLLGGHLAGIRHYAGLEFLSDRSYRNVRRPLEVFQDDPQLAPPGARFSYTTYGWTLISAGLAGAAEQDFLELLDELVIEPLGMQRTCADRPTPLIPGRARWYQLGADGFLNAPAVDLSNKWAGGGLLSTPTDLVRFGSAHLAPGYLSAESLELLLTPMRDATGASTGYGLGWARREGDGSGPLHGHSGGSVGGTTAFLMHPQSGVVVALVSNLSQAPLSMADAEALALCFARESQDGR